MRNPPMQRTFIVHVEDRPGVLNRISSLFRRRNFSLESVTCARTERPEVSRLTLVVTTDDVAARQLEAHLYKLVDVLYVEDVTQAQAFVFELALVKVRADARARPQVLQQCAAMGARAVDVTPGSVLVELTAPRERVDALVAAMRPHGLIEVVRTGAVAVVRGSRSPLAELERATQQAGAEGTGVRAADLPAETAA